MVLILMDESMFRNTTAEELGRRLEELGVKSVIVKGLGLPQPIMAVNVEEK